MPLIPPEKKKNPSLFIHSDMFKRPAWGSNHPLAIPRQSAMLDLLEMLNWIGPDNTKVCHAANRKTLVQFHTPDYVDAFFQADTSGKVSQANRQKYQLGTMENPIFPGLFERAATTVGGSIMAAKLAGEGRIVFHPSGGTHHGRPDRASGFCYFNDPVFAILTLLNQGCTRIAYVDVDAHHGDGVQDAFTDEPRVRCISVHEENRWPHTGTGDDHGNGHAYNFPTPRGVGDLAYADVINARILPLVREFAPEAVVITFGADALDADPLSAMGLSNTCLLQTCVQICDLAPAAVVLGGGGYNPWTTARLWTAFWGLISDQQVQIKLPKPAREMLEGLECDLIDPEDMRPEWTTTLLDPALGAS
ncbi:MAG: acetoin utilization protein AcuC [Robiginitomaculum sp.]|nr:MAG: acetoin utilization protein AcuC [Robiginitomaculum sp.]